MALNPKFFNIKLPFARDPNSTYFQMNTTAESAALDDLKMMIFSNKRERVMNPTFGVGIDEFVFEQDQQKMKVEITNRIIEQSRLLTNVIVSKVEVKTYEEIPPADRFNINKNTIVISVNWKLKNTPMEEKTLKINVEI